MRPSSPRFKHFSLLGLIWAAIAGILIFQGTEIVHGAKALCALLRGDIPSPPESTLLRLAVQNMQTKGPSPKLAAKLEEILYIDPHHGALFFLGELHLAQKDYARATLLYRRFMETDPWVPDTYLRLHQIQKAWEAFPSQSSPLEAGVTFFQSHCPSLVPREDQTVSTLYNQRARAAYLQCLTAWRSLQKEFEKSP